MINVEIITIGDELLIGQVIDTNSAWMAIELNKLGFDVQFKTTVGDNEKDIMDAVENAFSRASIILITGGIGPTKDDITKKTLCKFFNSNLVFDENTLATVQKIVKNIGKELNELTKAQAWVPDNAIVIQNQSGTAPVTWFEKDGKVLASMPGVPFEMKWVMANEILPRLKDKFLIHDSILHKTFWVSNHAEAELAIKLTDFEGQLPDYIKLAYLPNYGIIRLRLTGKLYDEKILREEMEVQSSLLIQLLGKDIFSEGEDTLELLLHTLLQKRGLTLALAESCTGGKLASLFTAIPGASLYFKGGVVSYTNDAKNEILGVCKEDIETEGAVSQTVVEQMVKGAMKIFHSDCAIATSGIAGPDGGTPEKPVGTVWIAVAYKDRLVSHKYLFSKNRESNILRASNTALLMLLELLTK